MKELALFYPWKKLSLTVLSEGNGHDIPIELRTILETTNTPFQTKSDILL
jgi:hypothetical protein